MQSVRNLILGIGLTFIVLHGLSQSATRGDEKDKEFSLLEPKPLVPDAKVVTLWPKGSAALRALAGYDKPEIFNVAKDKPERVQTVENIHNPSIEVHLAPSDKAIGMAVIVAPGGGNKVCVVGSEGTDIAAWLNGLGV